MSSQITEFIAASGGVEVLLEVSGPEGMRFEELVEEVSIARSTLAKRLHTALDLDLIYTRTVEGERGTANEYRISARGGKILVQMEQQDMLVTYRIYKDHREKFEDQKADLVDWVADNEDEIREQPVKKHHVVNLLAEDFPEVADLLAQNWDELTEK